jgi:hypothetical protein
LKGKSRRKSTGKNIGKSKGESDEDSLEPAEKEEKEYLVEQVKAFQKAGHCQSWHNWCYFNTDDVRDPRQLTLQTLRLFTTRRRYHRFLDEQDRWAQKQAPPLPWRQHRCDTCGETPCKDSVKCLHQSMSDEAAFIDSEETLAAEFDEEGQDLEGRDLEGQDLEGQDLDQPPYDGPLAEGGDEIPQEGEEHLAGGNEDEDDLSGILSPTALVSRANLLLLRAEQMRQARRDMM